MVIAIDGPAGAGKSTVARAVAERLGFTYLDSGAMYRCVALAVLRDGVDPDDATAVTAIAQSLSVAVSGDSVELDGEDVSESIRSPEVSVAASQVSVHPGVREAMVERQRALIAAGDWVAEGRDIGTVVAPEAAVKVFLTAHGDERARRRAAESGAPLDEVLSEQRRRDARDSGRAHSPLRAAPDAEEVDTTGLAIGEVVDQVVALARARGSR